MGEVIRFVPKAELERARLIREARAIYDSIFPPTDARGERQDGRTGRGGATEVQAPAPSQGNIRIKGRS